MDDSSVINHLGQPIGFALPDWTPRERPSRSLLTGRFCRLEPLDPDRHATALYQAFSGDLEQRMWTYLPYGPFATFAAFDEWLRKVAAGDDPLFFTIIEAQSNQPAGACAYLRIDPANGSIEVGHLLYSPALQQTPAATEAMYLMMRNAFELGYRRYEWKCDSLNAASRAAATRLGFQFEGLFRQAVVYKQRSRDTAWYSILKSEWPPLESALLDWLSPGNFDDQGQQRSRLSDRTSTLRQHD